MTEPSTHDAAAAPPLLWSAAIAIAAFGSWMLFDAYPGLNWFLWVASAAAGLILFTRPANRTPVVLTAGAATVIAGGAVITGSMALTSLSCLAVMLYLAIAMLLAAAPSIRSLTLWFAATAPIVAFIGAATQTLRRAVEATQLIRSHRTRAWVRGLVITVPVVVVFALLLANADPVFAAGRDAIEHLFSDWNFLPRTIFGGCLLVVTLGAYGHAVDVPAGQTESAGTHARWLGSTERLILLGAVAALFWLFLAVQVGYFFGDLPSTPASGITFAEYARRGFAELTVVASASALLIVGAERFGNDERRSAVRVVTFALIAAVLLLLASAFRRVLLYEAAYGFTTSRLYAQVYMCAVAAGLLILTIEVAAEFDAGRLFRRATAAVTVLFIGLVYWNHLAWIAGQNFDRFERTGKLDQMYLIDNLGPDALPVIAERMTSLPSPMQVGIRAMVRDRYFGRRNRRISEWYEWNLARERADETLAANFMKP